MRVTVALSGEALNQRLIDSFSGVGLLRGEYVFRRYGVYPTAESVSDRLVPYLIGVAEAAGAQPVWYRSLEVTTTEANVLSGVEELILDESHQLMGLRGIRRAIRHPEHFRHELAGLRAVAETVPASQLGLIIPFLTTSDEMAWAAEELGRIAPAVALATMIETPAALLSIDRLIGLGIRRAVIGVNDLSSLVDARARVVAQPVLPTEGLVAAIKLARAATHRHGVELAVAGYLSAELIEASRELGVDECVVHYHDLPRLFGSRWSDLPELELLMQIKRKTKQDIASLAATGVPR